MNDLDLSSLSTGPVPALAPTDQVKARGDQRRNRGRVALAGAAALLVLAGAGTAAGLATRGTPDALQIANSPTPTPRVAAVPAAFLPTPEDATRAAGGVWDPGMPVSDQGLLLHICPRGEGFDQPGVSRFLQQDNAGANTFVSVLPTGEPKRWVHTFRQAAIDCPRRAADSEDGKASNSFELLSGVTLDAAVIRDSYRECDTCPASVTLWIAVGNDEVLSVTQLTDAKEPKLEGWVDVLHARLADPYPHPVTPTPTPSSEPVVFGPLGPQDLVESDRIGPVVIGMTLAQAEAAAEQDLRQEGDDLGGCVYYSLRSGVPDVSFMVINGVVSRIDVDSGTTTTNLSIGIGATEDDVKSSYPNAVTSKHPHTNGHYLRVLDDDGRHAIIFETDGNKVTSFRGGYASAVDQIEGCA